MGVYGAILCLLSDPAEIFVSDRIKNVDTHLESLNSKKKQVIKKLSPKSLWQTYMKWTVGVLKWNWYFKAVKYTISFAYIQNMKCDQDVRQAKHEHYMSLALNVGQIIKHAINIKFCW